MDTEAWRRAGVDATRKLLHEIFHHPHSTTGAVGAENCLVCLRAIATHTEAAVKAAIEDERQQAAAATRKIFNMLPIEMSYQGRLVPVNSTGMREIIDDVDRRVEAALVADRLARHDETVAAIEAAVKGKECLTCGIAGGHKSGCYELRLNDLKTRLADKQEQIFAQAAAIADLVAPSRSSCLAEKITEQTYRMRHMSQKDAEAELAEFLAERSLPLADAVAKALLRGLGGSNG